MGAMFRSEEMSLAQLFIQPEAAYYVVSELGESACVQFRDLNVDVNLFQRTFATEIKRCDEMERQLRYIEEEIKKSNVKVPNTNETPKAPNPRQIVDLEAHLEKTERDVLELSTGAKTLQERLTELKQTKSVLQKAQTFFNQQEDIINSEPQEFNISQLGFIAGVINKEKIFAFERLLWRIGRGNIYIRWDDIEEITIDHVTGKEQTFCAFIAFYQGENLHQKVIKVCHGFKAHIIECPVSLNARNESVKRITLEIADIQNVLNQNNDHVSRLLVSVAKEIQNWTVMVCKMKAIYHTLNCFSLDVTRKCLIAEGWVPTSDISNVQRALAAGSVACGSSVPSFLNVLKSNEIPPTYNRTNKFTKGFQNLISSYGFATYRELNPALYTIITFPFLFAVMFGDVGHAIIMTMFGAFLVIKEKKLMADKNKGEIFGIFFAGRYILLLMGIFSMYTGFLYNDIFSKSMNIFGTKWRVKNLPDGFIKYDSTYTMDLLPRESYLGTPYFIGMDPAWQAAKNKIIFLNSFKMKLSIVLGVIHMLFGIILSTLNFVHFKKLHALILDFLPKILFFLFLFVYLVSMIFMKWSLYSGTFDGKFDNDTSPGVDTPHGSSCAPSVLIYFIGMMLMKQTDATAPCQAYMFEGQHYLQYGLLFCGLACIPVLLLGTPLYEMSQRKKARAARLPVVHHHDGNGHVHVHPQPELHIQLETIPENSIIEEEEPASEIWVHAAIETIEYTLSTVSHTASYLRLWALSLAHSQLSEVLWSMVFHRGLVIKGYMGAISTYLAFIPWAAFTIAILVLMEGLSAFLHTLRLHWVEFMTKFYKGEGYDFSPFSFSAILDADQD